MCVVHMVHVFSSAAEALGLSVVRGMRIWWIV